MTIVQPCAKMKRTFSFMLCCVVTDGSEFDVESLNFPGQVHRWRLTQMLQKGTERARESLLNVCHS